jgi:hypothetical protein
MMLAIGLGVGCWREEDATYRYFRVVDETVYSASPSKYERVSYPGTTRERAIYVEREPAHEIAASGIVSVTVSKTKIYGDSPEERKELEKRAMEIITKGTVTKNKYETYPRGFFYTLTFKLTPDEWKRYVVFCNNNLRESYEMRLGTRHQGVLPVSLRGKRERRRRCGIRYRHKESDVSRIKERLLPLKNKLVWD